MKVKNATILLLTGIAIGTITGLLIAPDEGAKTRKKLLRKAKKIKREIENKASDYKDKVIDLKENIEEAAHDVKKRFS